VGGIEIPRFCEELDPEWQAEIMAAYIMDGQVEAVLAQDSERKRRDRDQAANKPGDGWGGPAPDRQSLIRGSMDGHHDKS
jgi:hypothetical protein